MFLSFVIGALHDRKGNEHDGVDFDDDGADSQNRDCDGEDYPYV